MVQIMKKILILAILLILPLTVIAEQLKFVGLKAYDGDTVRTPIRALKGLPTLSIRFYGIDTPEIRGACEYEKSLAIKARDRLNVILEGEVTVTPMGWDKYGGRFTATIHDMDGRNVAYVLIAEGLGRPYFGEKKQSWCE